MSPKKPVRIGSEPKCWWCHIDISLDCPYRGEAPELNLPLGVGVVVCTPGCPERPEGIVVWDVKEIFKE